MTDQISCSNPSALALAGTSVARVLNTAVEIVEAVPADRRFPDRVTDSLGLCLKIGPGHEVRADGRALCYPADAVCVRAPGCVWSTESTGDVGFLSLDIEPHLLPAGGLVGTMRFVEVRHFPDLRACIEILRSDTVLLQKETVIAELIDSVTVPGLLRLRDGDLSTRLYAADHARELLESVLEAPPGLEELAAKVGVNHFVLLRQFKRKFGLPPYAFVLRARVERARARLARGESIAEAALALGFADQSHLSRIFKRIVGLSPSAYQRSVRTSISV